MIQKTDRRPISLTSRVLLFVMLAISLCLMLSSLLIVKSIKHHFAAQDTDELHVITQAISTALQTVDNGKQTLNDALLHAVSGHHGVYFQVENKQGRQLYRSPGPDFTQNTAHLPLPENTHHHRAFSWQSDGNTYRGLVSKVTTSRTEYRVIVAIDMAFHLQFLKTFHRSLWLIMLTTGTLTLLAAWFGIHQGHLPLRSLSDSIRQIQTGKLHLRLDPNTVPSELQELVQSFNVMIEHLEQDFERLSHFSSDIAHELRTPLTNLITQTQVVLSKPRQAEIYRELLYSGLEEQERLAKMVSDMLWLAKSENALIKPDMAPLDIAQEVHELFDFFDALVSEKQLTLTLEGPACTVLADRALIRRALSNLLSNAIRHTPRGESIRVKLHHAEQQLELSVINPGETIAAEHLPKLFERFYRVDPSRQRNSDGAGLGLAIAKSIVTVHGGKIIALSGDGVTEFKLTLSIATPDTMRNEV